MELDTGATLSLISSETYHRLWNCNLKTYTGERLNVIGELEVTVTLESQRKPLKLLVVEGNGPSLFGRNWLEKLKLNWSQLQSDQVCSITNVSLQEVLRKHSVVFKEDLGCVQGSEAKIYFAVTSSPQVLQSQERAVCTEGEGGTGTSTSSGCRSDHTSSTLGVGHTNRTSGQRERRHQNLWRLQSHAEQSNTHGELPTTTDR